MAVIGAILPLILVAENWVVADELVEEIGCVAVAVMLMLVVVVVAAVAVVVVLLILVAENGPGDSRADDDLEFVCVAVAVPDVVYEADFLSSILSAAVIATALAVEERKSAS